MAKKYIEILTEEQFKNISDGELIKARVIIKNKEVKPTKNGGKYLALKCRVAQFNKNEWVNEDFIAKTFDNKIIEELEKLNMEGYVIGVFGTKTSYNGTPQMDLKGAKLLEKITVENVKKNEEDIIDKDYLYIFDNILSMASPYRYVLLELLEEHEEKYKNAPYNLKFEGDYAGALIEHTAKCLQVYNKLKELDFISENVNDTVMKFIIIANDISKMLTYDLIRQDNDIERLVGHISLSFAMVYQKLEKYDIPAKEKAVIYNAILGQHEKVEFGSPKPPYSAEAQLLVNVQRIVNNTFIIKNAKDKAENKEGFIADNLYNINFTLYTEEKAEEKTEEKNENEKKDQE